MKPTWARPLNSVFREFARAAGGLTLVIGLATLAGWSAGVHALTNLIPGTKPMNPLSGMAFALGGTALFLAAAGNDSRRRRTAVRVLGILVAVVGTVRLGDCLSLWTQSLDAVIFEVRAGYGRMAPNTALAFVLSGLALLALEIETPRGMRPAQWMAIPVLGIAGLAVLGYFYGAQALYSVGVFAPMSFPTSVAFLVLSLGVLCARPERGVMALLASHSIGGAMARRLLPAAVITLSSVGWLRLYGERLGWYGTEYGLALFTLANMTIFTVLILWVGRQLARIDLDRQAAAQGLSEARDELERRVRDRTRDLARVVEELSEGVNVLAANAMEIMTVTRELAEGANDIAVALNATASTVEEMRQMANVTSRQAAHVAETSERAAGMSSCGKMSTEDVIVGMRRIGAEMEGIDGAMVRLREQARTIGQIVATVDDLAAQSSVLAVNAAIEAAKAGPHGKGFAVVAREVKSLARQSKLATREVREILGEILKASRGALAATERGRLAVEGGSAQSLRAGESIDALAASLADAVQAATQIAASSRQQLEGADHVVMATGRVQQIGARYAAGTTKLEEAARALDVLGRRLKATVETRRDQAERT